MQDLKALEGKSLAELREIAKALGIEDVMVKKRELIEKITGGSAQETPAENKGKRGRKKETPAAVRGNNHTYTAYNFHNLKSHKYIIHRSRGNFESIPTYIRL